MPTTKKHSSRGGRVLIISLVVALLLIGAAAYRVYTASGFGASYTDPPKFIQHDFIDLDHITTISKFRSEAGHDFSDGTETCRSMKHYFAANQTRTADGGNQPKDASKKLADLQPDGKTDVAIYSPVAGRISKVQSEHTELGKQIWIVPDSASGYAIRLFHVTPDDSLHGDLFILPTGSHVTAGQKIGVISAKQDVDIAVETGSTGINQHFISYFDVMPDSIFTSYQARGLASRADIIITKAERDAHTFDCKHDSDDSFVYPANYNENTDYVRLTGYVAPVNTPSNTGVAGSPATKNAATTGVINNVCNTAVGKPPGCP